MRKKTKPVRQPGARQFRDTPAARRECRARNGRWGRAPLTLPSRASSGEKSLHLQGAPVLDRFSNMGAAQRGCIIEIGDRPCHFEHAMIGPGRPVHLRHRGTQQLFTVARGRAECIDFPGAELAVGLALPGDLAIERLPHPQRDCLRRLAVGLADKVLMRQGSNLDLHVDPVQQRPRDLSLVTSDLIRRAAAFVGRVTEKAAGAWIHGGDQLKPGRKIRLPGGSGNRDAAGLQRFAQHLQHLSVEFRQLVQEQHAPVRQRNLTWPGNASAVVF